MKQFKHTPAPWIYNGTIIETPNGTALFYAEQYKDERDANARLIAAAPELLEALVECLEGVKELNGEYQDGWDTVIEKASLIVKKATE